MSDALQVLSASGLIHTGQGLLVGFLATTSAASAVITFYDHDEGSGTKLVEIQCSPGEPAKIFFSEPFMPKFSIGLYVVLPANTSVTVWVRKV